MQKINLLLKNFWGNKMLAYSCAALIFIFYAAGLFYYAHNEYSVLDEGLYSYKGYLFASGQYAPFESGGPWMNKPPLAFLIPGWAQIIFGAGLRTARYFSIGLTLSGVAALWLTTKRLTGEWSANLAIFLFALSPLSAKNYSAGVTQGEVVCILLWIVFFSFGKDRPRWGLMAAGFLSAILIFVRAEFIIFLGIFYGFIIWKEGWRRSLFAIGSSLLVIIFIHIFYWPKMMTIWAPLFPPSITPFLNAWRESEVSVGGFGLAKIDISFQSRVVSGTMAVAWHFAAILGVFGVLMFYPRGQNAEFQKNLKETIFLGVGSAAMFAVYLYAALTKDYCVFCLSGYLDYFAVFGIIAFVINVRLWQKTTPLWGQIFLFAMATALTISLVKISSQVLTPIFYNRIQKIEPLSDYLTRQNFPIAIGLLIVAGIFIIGMILAILPGLRKSSWAYRTLFFLMFISLVAQTQLAQNKIPLRYLPDASSPCRQDKIDAYETIGSELKKIIPEGSKIYWDGYTAIPLLYLKDIKIFPTQLNLSYSKRETANNDLLWNLGFWNDDLANQWLAQSDYAIDERMEIRQAAAGGEIRVETLSTRLKEAIERNEFTEITISKQINVCGNDVPIRIYKRNH